MGYWARREAQQQENAGVPGRPVVKPQLMPLPRGPEVKIDSIGPVTGSVKALTVTF